MENLFDPFAKFEMYILCLHQIRGCFLCGTTVQTKQTNSGVIQTTVSGAILQLYGARKYKSLRLPMMITDECERSFGWISQLTNPFELSFHSNSV